MPFAAARPAAHARRLARVRSFAAWLAGHAASIVIIASNETVSIEDLPGQLL
jgi:hypothetical protein